MNGVRKLKEKLKNDKNFKEKFKNVKSEKEAVELAKRYGSENSPAFINGVLAKMI